MLKKRSIKNAVGGYSALIIVLFVLFFTIMLNSVSSMLRQSTYDGLRQTMNLYRDDITENLNKTRSVLILNCLNNYDINHMCYNIDETDLLIDQLHVQTLTSILLSGLTNTDGIFIYARETDSFISDARPGTQRCEAYLRRVMREEEEANLVSVDHWTLRLINGKYYLVNIMDLFNCFAGAWVQLDTLTSSFENLDTDAIFLYTDARGHALGNPLKQEEKLDPIRSLDMPVNVFYNNTRYLQTSVELPFCDYYLIALIPTQDVYNPIIRLGRLLMIGLLVLIVVAVITLQLPRRLFMRPVRRIEETAAKLSENDYSLQIPIYDKEYEEIRDLIMAINGLLADATSLQQQVYEEKLQKTEFELQYLKSQVAPHFLINCFSAIGAIPDTPEGKKVRTEMIRTLSEHLRYVLGQRQYVTLDEELYYVENYLALSAIRFPECLSYEIEADEETRKATVFPLLVLMLTENAIKHNLIMGEEFFVGITCTVEPVTEEIRSSQEESDRYDQVIHIVHTDSGDGYPEDMLDSLNHIVEQGRDTAEDGHHLGIYNIIKRSEILLDHKLENGGVHFSNNESGGARCDIMIPYRRMQS